MRSILPLALQSTLAQTPLPFSSSYSPFTSSFDSHVHDVLEQWHAPGLAVAVIHQNQTWTKGYGYASVEDKQPVTAHTLFAAASTTKSHTASAAALLVQDNGTYAHIDWSTPLSELARDDFVLHGLWETSQVTLEDALSHRTGLPRHDAVWINRNVSDAEAARSLRHLVPSAPIRTKWQYCNLMFATVSHIIQLVTGKTLESVFKEWLWTPLNMNETFLSYDGALSCRQHNPQCLLAKGYGWHNKTASHVELPWSEIPYLGGAGGVITNVHDYAKWVSALMWEAGPLGAAGHKALRDPRSIASTANIPFTGPTWYGLGLSGSVYRGERVFFHTGAILGFVSQILFIPDRKWGVVTLQNAPNLAQDALVWTLIDNFLQVPEAERKDMNRIYFDKAYESINKTANLPAKLYPESSRPRIPMALPVEEYQGLYSHVAYGNLTLKLREYDKAKGQEHPMHKGEDGVALFARARWLGVEYTFHHVTGEHWLVAEEMGLHEKLQPDGYTKSKFEIGAAGQVESIKIIVEPEVKGEGAWAEFRRID